MTYDRKLRQAPGAEIDAQFEEVLVLIERKLSEGATLVTRQRKLVEKMRPKGLDTTLAEDLLVQFKDALALRQAVFETLRASRPKRPARDA